MSTSSSSTVSTADKENLLAALQGTGETPAPTETTATPEATTPAAEETPAEVETPNGENSETDWKKFSRKHEDEKKAALAALKAATENLAATEARALAAEASASELNRRLAVKELTQRFNLPAGSETLLEGVPFDELEARAEFIGNIAATANPAQPQMVLPNQGSVFQAPSSEEAAKAALFNSFLR